MTRRLFVVTSVTYALACMGFGSTAVVEAAEESLACDTTQLASVEFLRGDWTVRVINPNDPTGRHRGVSTVSTIADGCALQEELRLENGYEEVRILGFDEGAGVWQLSIVDSGHGNLMLLNGHETEDGLEFITTHQRSSALLVDRISITEAEWGWVFRVESAPGYGEDWRLLQEIRYTAR